MILPLPGEPVSPAAEAAAPAGRGDEQGSGEPARGDEQVSGEAAPGDEQGPAEGEERTGYTVHLDRFDGPLDLLLFLIQRDEIDIYDIPIAHITERYLAFIEDLDALDLEKAGEFLVMASTLMRIKARLLLPLQRPDEDEEGEDPRDELVRRLLEYKRFKEAAATLAQAEEERRQYFRRSLEYPFRDSIPEEPPELSLSLMDLLGSVKEILENLKEKPVHQVYQELFTVEEKIAYIETVLTERRSIPFVELFDTSRSKMEVVVTFVAMLELMKSGRVRARQVENYGEIWLYWREESQ